ncbi:MAG: glycosyltransferase [Acidobacteria bacterium]|nr:glycosyltransferase [Acidobacteriota bacterium]
MLPKTEVFSWLKQAYLSIFVVKDTPFLATASPNKVFDAFAVGVPIIQTTQGWIKTLLDQEKGGITIQPYDANALLEALKHLEDNPTYYALLSENSKRLGQTLFNRDELAKSYLTLLENMLPPAP